MEIPAITMQVSGSVWDQLPNGIKTVQPQPMENFDQDQGLMLYRTKLVGHKGGKLTIWEPHDYALVFLDGKFIDTVIRDGGKWTVDLPKPADTRHTPVLEILVEGMGHINFAQFMIDRKGITDRVTLNGMTLMNWEQFSLSMQETFIRQLKKGTPRNPGKSGLFFSGNFSLSQTADTYFDMSAYSKGMLYVNGHNLGRYWNTGPQQRLYCPASWLKKGTNEILVFDLHQLEAKTISGKTTLE